MFWDLHHTTGLCFRKQTIIPRGRPHLSEGPNNDNSFTAGFYYYEARIRSPEKRYKIKVYNDDDVNKKVYLPYLVSNPSNSDIDLSNSSDPRQCIVQFGQNFVLSRVDTLTSPKYGLPAIRAIHQSIYQQSIAMALV